MTLPSFVRVEGRAVLLSLKVQPRASRNEIGGILGNELKVKLTAPPVDSAANEALVEFLANAIGCARSSIQITRGLTSRHKTIAIHGSDPVTIASALAT